MYQTKYYSSSVTESLTLSIIPFVLPEIKRLASELIDKSIVSERIAGELSVVGKHIALASTRSVASKARALA